jgi:hypothetical protein
VTENVPKEIDKKESGLPRPTRSNAKRQTASLSFLCY